MTNITKYMSVILVSLALHFYFYGSEHIQKFDYAFYDFTTRLAKSFHSPENASYTVVIDIDDKSLQHLGQSPWPRVLDARLIDKLQTMHPSSIGVNIIFPEKDRVSPVSMQKFYKDFFNLKLPLNEIPKNLQDNDKLLSESIRHANATLSIYLGNDTHSTPICQQLVYKNNLFATIKTDYFKASSILCNEESLQKDVENFGFINAWQDNDGIFRRIPLFMHYQDQIFPSLAVATLLSFDPYIQLPTKEETLLINFSQKPSKIFSAIDLFHNHIPIDEIRGKVVIIGSSVIGLTPTYITTTGQKISNSLIHAYTIENILNNTLVHQPIVYKQINITLSFLLSIIVIFLLWKKQYTLLIILLASLILISFVLLILTYIYGLYISIGYLWMPFLYFFIIMVMYHLRIVNRETQEQEKFLIRQSKLASMGEMISLIAHQWRQPLSAINALVFNIDMDYHKNRLDSQKLNTHLNNIEKTTAYLSETINDFSTFFSNNKYQEQFYIGDTVTQALHLLPHTYKQKIKISYKESNTFLITTYRSELLQSLLILLNNALYACEENLSTTHQGHIIISTYMLQKEIFISIEDNGGGIDPQHIKRIFDPYFTTKSKPHGTGLGLYILKLIVEDSLNGKVTVNNVHEGAVFTIRLPTTF